ncbi:hypothetical protein [Solimonas marina]|uniref:Uncharacterized protein n=1 Tax=Solimonas marina TaxID=2714601 RepID=A0A970B9E2_9GAMM|nr:hypothetical protein [Solimonas marina]NKF23244.1 hypothetical protein [Solimonas marina]
MRVLLCGLLVGSALLSACSATRRCEGDQAYQDAKTLPTPGQIPGLTVPQSPTALNIPPAPADQVPFGQKVKNPKGGTEWACLDQPPHMTGGSEEEEVIYTIKKKQKGAPDSDKAATPDDKKQP